MIFDLSTRRRGEADEIDVLIWWCDEGFKYSLSLSIFGTGAGTDIDTDINANANAGAMLCYAKLTHSQPPPHPLALFIHPALSITSSSSQVQRAAEETSTPTRTREPSLKRSGARPVLRPVHGSSSSQAPLKGKAAVVQRVICCYSLLLLTKRAGTEFCALTVVFSSPDHCVLPVSPRPMNHLNSHTFHTSWAFNTRRGQNEHPSSLCAVVFPVPIYNTPNPSFSIFLYLPKTPFLLLTHSLIPPPQPPSPDKQHTPSPPRS
jgi:hypothetical protein